VRKGLPPAEYMRRAVVRQLRNAALADAAERPTLDKIRPRCIVCPETVRAEDYRQGKRGRTGNTLRRKIAKYMNK
jgi:hypothetical protein